MYYKAEHSLHAWGRKQFQVPHPVGNFLFKRSVFCLRRWNRITSRYTSFKGGQKEKEGPHDVKDGQVFETISLVTSEYYSVREYSRSLDKGSHPSLLCSDSLL